MRKTALIFMVGMFLVGCQATLTPEQLKEKLNVQVPDAPQRAKCYNNDHGINACAMSLWVVRNLPNLNNSAVTVTSVAANLNVIELKLRINRDEQGYAKEASKAGMTVDEFTRYLSETVMRKGFCRNAKVDRFFEYGGRLEVDFTLNDLKHLTRTEISSC